METARVVRDGDGRVIGAVLVELDAELGQAWVLGPWVAGDDEAWDRFAGSLVEAALAQVPASFTGRTLSGHTDNIRLAQLAGRLGLAARVCRPRADGRPSLDRRVAGRWVDQ